MATVSILGLPTASNTIGALLIGWGISCLCVQCSCVVFKRSTCGAHSVLGLIFVQGWTYFVRYPNDGPSYKSLVRLRVHSSPRLPASQRDSLCCAGRLAAVRPFLFVCIRFSTTCLSSATRSLLETFHQALIGHSAWHYNVTCVCAYTFVCATLPDYWPKQLWERTDL
jgi:hypothetical protein